ncbi:MAG: molybdopterin-dependent oxidoreductase [Syntrophomonadaceae bacterium]|nr:molybdopterin-dependent oxidoreductase [Syntrophomonadaceae bacterium]MDD3889565.1 molybdopterin-dependent oxidoreductase [Syntrophomonadaceae bacterium]MDD4550135.1 molybdopterin-dependent oxidoreductase [Syntrophomonadaceae bacterium]
MNNDLKLSRRTFLKLTGLTTAYFVVDPPLRNLSVAYAFGDHPQEKPTYTVTKKIPQVCARACECDCNYDVVVGVDQATGLERALTLEGRPEDPVSRGKYCIKALGFVDSMYNPDRLLVSLKRTNPKRGLNEDPGWVKISTEDAVQEIIDKLKKYRPEQMLFASPGDPYSNRLCRSLGVTRTDQRTECFGTHYYLNSLMITNPPNKYYSSTYTVTHSLWGFDYSETKYMLWFGFDSFSKTGKSGILNHIVEGKRNGTKIVAFNPLKTPLADGIIDEWYPIKPGTDLAVTLAMIKIILDEKLYQADFVKDYTDAAALIDTETKMHITDESGKWLAWSTANNKAETLGVCDKPALDGGPYTVDVGGKQVQAVPVLELLKQNVKDCTPEWAEKISEVPGQDISRITKEFAQAAPTVCIPNLKRDPAGPNYANSWRLMHSLNILQALTGSLDHDGGVLFLHGVKIPWLEEVDPIPKPYPEQPKKSIDYRTEYPVTNKIYREKDYSAPGHYGMVGHGLYHSDQVKVVIFKGPHRGLHALIQPQMTEAALEKMDLVADWNMYPDDAAYWCDYILPAPHQYEGGKLDIRQYYPKWPCLVGGAPVQKPPGDCIGWGSIAKKIGLALAPEYWTTDGSNNPEKAIKGNMNDAALQAVGAAKDQDDFINNKNAIWIDKKPYENYKTIREIGYQRPEGRVRLYIDEFVEDNHEGLPKWAERWTSSEGEYKFSLLVTRAGWHMHADPNFIDNPVINMLSNKNHIDCVWVNPEAGKELGLQEGDEVIVTTNPKYMPELPRPIKSKIHLTERMARKDCILLFHGIGHRSKWLKNGVWGYRDGDLIPQKNPKIGKPHDPTGMGWVEDVYVSIKKA